MAKFIPLKVYKTIIRNAPIVSSDIVINFKNKFLLLKRVNEPCRGLWWTPGGRVSKNEKILDSVYRVVKEEIGIKKIKIKKFLGVFDLYCEPGKFKEKNMHYVSFAFLVEPIGKFNIKIDFQHSEYNFFASPPSNSHPFIKKLFFLSKKKHFKATPPVSYEIKPHSEL